MPHKRRYDIVAITGKYTNSEGQEKSRYANLGVVLENERGALSIKLESIPVGWDGWAYLNEPRPRDGERPAPKKRDDDQVPF